VGPNGLDEFRMTYPPDVVINLCNNRVRRSINFVDVTNANPATTIYVQTMQPCIGGPTKSKPLLNYG